MSFGYRFVSFALQKGIFIISVERKDITEGEYFTPQCSINTVVVAQA